MEIHRRSNIDCIDFVVDDLITPLGVPPAGTKFFRKFFREILPRSADRDKFAIRQIAEGRRNPLSSNVACTDQTPPKSCHKLKLFSFDPRQPHIAKAST